MSSYRIIPHTADVRLHVEGRTLEELFAEALLGMADIQKSNIRDKKLKIKKNIRIQSPDSTALLIDFLSEALTHSHVEKAVFSEARFERLTDTELDAEVSGVPVDAFDEDIKAVTYHEAEVRKNEKGNHETTIVFDI